MISIKDFKVKFDSIVVDVDRAIDSLDVELLKRKLYELVDLCTAFLMRLENYKLLEREVR